MDKEDVVYIYHGVLLGNQKEWNLAICNYVDGTGGITLSEITQSEKEKIHRTCLVWGLSESKQMNKREGKQK